MTGMEIYMERLAMAEGSILDKFEKLHIRAHGPGYGGQTEYFMESGKMVGPLINVAKAAFRLMGEGQNYHHDSKPYQELVRDLHNALKEVEGA